MTCKCNVLCQRAKWCGHIRSIAYMLTGRRNKLGLVFFKPSVIERFDLHVAL